MKNKKFVGIWMDHSSATILEPNSGGFLKHSVKLGFPKQERLKVVSKSEHILHNKENQKQAAYYAEIQEGLEKYDGILLFGPTHAKDELRNLMKSDHRFDHIQVDVEKADQMTEHQQHAFIRKHFRLD